MPFPLKDDFKPGPLTQLTADWLNTVARILNYLSTNGCRLKKTPVPTAVNPWEIIVDGSASVSSAVPSDATPQPPATSGAAGTADTYSRANHVHPAMATGQGSLITIANSGTAAAQSTTWLAGNAGKQPIKRWFHRYYYDGSTGSEKIVGVQHYEIHDAVTGALLEVGAESTYTMHSPEYAQ